MSESPTVEVSVIIPVYNDTERLKLCLQALENQTFTGNAYEVIVVDNRSSEPVAPVVASFPHVRCAREDQQGSYAARNLGLTLARGSILGFTDADCIPYPDWIERGVAVLSQDEQIGLVGGQVELFCRDPQRPTAAELYELMGSFNQKVYIEQKNYSATANLFTTRRVMNSVGPFNGDLISGGDGDWGRRVAAAGYRLVYADDVVIRHPARHSLAELRAKATRLSEGRYRIRKAEANQSLWRTLMRILISFIPPKRTLRIYAHPDLHGRKQKTQALFVTLYMRYYVARWNLKFLWKDLRSRVS